MVRNNLNNSNLVYGKILIAISFILTAFFMFSRANGILNDRFFNVFVWVVIIVTALWVFSYFLETKTNFTELSAYNERIPGSKLSQLSLWQKLFIFGGGLSLLFSLGAIGLNSPIIPVPELSSVFTANAASSVTGLDKVMYQSVYPGFKEESGVYFICLGLKFLAMLFILRKNPKLMPIVFLLIAFVGDDMLKPEIQQKQSIKILNLCP